MTTRELLDLLFDYQCQLDALELQRQAEHAKAMTPEILAQLDAIDAEFADKAKNAQANIAELTAQIKTAALSDGQTIKGKGLQAVFVKGRVTWDAKALDGYALSKPELLAFRHEGEPSITIRKT